jgi:hypothetical protein
LSAGFVLLVVLVLVFFSSSITGIPLRVSVGFVRDNPRRSFFSFVSSSIVPPVFHTVKGKAEDDDEDEHEYEGEERRTY